MFEWEGRAAHEYAVVAHHIRTRDVQAGATARTRCCSFNPQLAIAVMLAVDGETARLVSSSLTYSRWLDQNQPRHRVAIVICNSVARRSNSCPVGFVAQAVFNCLHRQCLSF